jgi:ABC-type tungstate transport system substrate-binding protein
MNLRNLYLVNTVVSLGFALGFLLMSPLLLGLFGMEYTADARTLGQLIAVELVVGGVITLLARDVTDAKALRAINTGNFAAGLIGTVIALLATLSGVMGWFGYVVTAVYLFIAVAFGYFQFMKPAR